MGKQVFHKDGDLTEDVDVFGDQFGRTKISKYLTQEESKKLKELMIKYRQVFALNPEEIGLTDIFVHRVETGDEPSISCAPYRKSPEKMQDYKYTRQRSRC